MTTPLRVGDTFELTYTFAAEAVTQYAVLTGDMNPVHLDADYARETPFERPIVHGLFVAGLFSRILGCDMPGPGTLYMTQALEFLAPVYVGDSIRARVEILELRERGRTRVSTAAYRAVDGTQVISGEAIVKIPAARRGESA
jgi:acyl dehydratase